jgi:hypothetical protein
METNRKIGTVLLAWPAKTNEYLKEKKLDIGECLSFETNYLRFWSNVDKIIHWARTKGFTEIYFDGDADNYLKLEKLKNKQDMIVKKIDKASVEYEEKKLDELCEKLKHTKENGDFQ